MLYLFEDFVLDTDKRELRRGADVVTVAPQVFDVLDYLIRNRERVVSKDDLVTAIWEGRIISDAALTTRVKAVRSAIGDSGEGQRLIKTLPRKGFRFVGRVQEEQGPGRALDGETPVEPPRPALALPDKPSIAVLAFTNMSGDPGQDYFSDGITEDIITESVAVLRAVRDRPQLELPIQGQGHPTYARSAASSACATFSKAASVAPAIASASAPSSSMPLPARTAGPSVTIAS